MTASPACTEFEPRSAGWTLPASYYLDEAVLAAELDTVFRANWLFAGHSCELTGAGDWLQFALGDESLLIVRDDEGQLHALHNVCRHRGSRLCEAPRGSATRAFVCPYHQWTYGHDGALRAARLMGDAFDKRAHHLATAHVREVAGLVFVCLAATPPPIEPFVAALRAQLGPHDLTSARIVHRQTYRVRANWKTLVENNRECYHCRGSHPEFLESNFEFGTHGDPRSSTTYDALLHESYERWTADGLAPAEVDFPDGQWFRVARLPLREGYLTETITGRPAAPPMGSVGQAPGSLRLISLPTLWAHANLDYAMTTRLRPRSPSATEVEVCFLVAADAQLDDAAIAELTDVWTSTSEQDWALCEANYAGVRSSAYRPGPLSDVVETSVEHFLGWYADQLAGC